MSHSQAGLNQLSSDLGIFDVVGNQINYQPTDDGDEFAQYKGQLFTISKLYLNPNSKDDTGCLDPMLFPMIQIQLVSNPQVDICVYADEIGTCPVLDLHCAGILSGVALWDANREVGSCTDQQLEQLAHHVSPFDDGSKEHYIFALGFKCFPHKV